MFRSTHPTGVLETRSRNSETLESNLIAMYRSQAEALRQRCDELEHQLARLLAKRVLSIPRKVASRCAQSQN